MKTIIPAAMAAVAVGACTAILGNDFEIVPAGSAGSAGNTGGGGSAGSDAGNGGTGGAQGGMGGMGPGPAECSFVEVQQIDDLGGLPAGFRHYQGGQIHMAMSDHAARLTVQRNEPINMQNIVELWSFGDSGTGQKHAYNAGNGEGFVRVDGSHIAAVLQGNPLTGTGRNVKLLMIDDSDDQGGSAVLEDVFTVPGDVQSFNVRAASNGDGAVSLVYTHRVQGQPFRALYTRWTSTGGTSPVEFDASSSLSSGDYNIGAMVHEGTNSHVVLGSEFEGATHRRRFVIPDNVAGTVAPATDEVVTLMLPSLLGILPRTDGNYLLGYAHFEASLSVLMGVLPAAELESHDPEAFPEVASLPPGSIPDEAAFGLSQDGFILVGHDMQMPGGLRVTLVHRLSGVRFNAFLPFPDPSIFPAAFQLERLAAVITSDLIDTVVGASVFVAFFLNDTDDPHHELYLARLECGPAA